tara:strand:- start:707 stop:1252 length:546 start_codon:yes stop_codon:yes gene_type:complete
MPRFTIKQLATALQSYPPLRSNQYEVYIQPPQALGGGLGGPYFASSVQFPGRSLATVERRTFGPQRDMPYERLFSGDLDITFTLTKGGFMRDYFEKWMDEIIDPETNRIKNSRERYLGELQIDVTGTDGSTEYGITVLEVFPKSISPVQLSYRSENEVLEQPVSFSFRDYRQRNVLESSTI